MKNVNVTEVSPEVIDGESRVSVGDEFVEEFDAVFTQIPVKNAVFGRVLLETIEEKGIPVDNYSTAYFSAAKKNYLYYVLHQRGIPAPETISVATEKAARDVEKYLDLPIIGRKLEELEEIEKRKLENSEEVTSFSEGIEYEEDVLLFQEHNPGSKYRCLVIGDEIISLSEDSEVWKFTGDNLKYSNISDTQEDIVENVCNSLGANIVEVLIRGEQVYDINPNPDLNLYSQKAGKDIFSAVADQLKGDIE